MFKTAWRERYSTALENAAACNVCAPDMSPHYHAHRASYIMCAEDTDNKAAIAVNID